MTDIVTIRDVSANPPRIVTGSLIKEYETGITIDDDRGVRYFAKKENIVETVRVTQDVATQVGDLLIWN